MIINRIKNILNRGFVKNVFTVASGTAAAQVIIMLSSPIITRLYGPEAFGVLGVFTSLVAIVSPIAALTYQSAIVLPKDDAEAKGLIHLSLYIALGIAIIMALSLTFFETQIVKLLQIDVLLPYLMLIPLVILLGIGRQVMEQWLIRKKQFKVTAKVSVLQAITINGAKIGTGLIYPFGAALIVIQTIGHGLHMLFLVFGAKKTISLSTITDKGYRQLTTLVNIAKKYSDFPIYRSPQVFIAAVTQSMPILMLTTMFGPAAAGFYSIGIKVLGIPSNLIGKSVGDVFYPRIAEAAQRNENISNLLLKATLSMAAIGLIPFGTITVFGPELFSFVFGDDWVVAGTYARWISLWSYALFVCNPSIRTLLVLSEQRFHLIFTIINIVVRAGAFIIGALIFNSDIVGVALFGISGALLSIGLTLVTLAKSKAHDEKANI